MATTDARTGFRLPWSSDQRPETDPVDGSEPDGANHGDSELAAQTTEGDTMIEAVQDGPTPVTDGATTEREAPVVQPAPDATPTRRPSKFLADLTKAMHTAAEAAREETVARLQAEAKTHVEDIHARSATEAADLRRRADDDVAAIREWSKAEIARIREETETRITDRKSRLETEIEEHAALIERQIERVQSRVSAFEEEMATFFERLLGEEDPTRFAAMAASLPEPPPFDGGDVAAAAAAAMVAPAPTAPVATEPSSPAAEPGAEGSADVDASQGVERATSDDPFSPPDDPEAAMAAIQAAAEAAAAEEMASGSTDAAVSHDGPTDGESPNGVESMDPRLSALAMSPDFEAAEAEALAAADAGQADEIEIPAIDDEAVAARLAGLVPAADGQADAPARSTQIVVTGLVSVASIASFKRHLGRLDGVQSVGVSSGPDGEFVFAVTHGDEVNLRDAVATLPGFAARVTGGTDQQIEVAAKDPESEA